MMEKQIIHMDSVGAVLLERSKKARRIVLTIRPFKGIRVAVPMNVSFQQAISFAVDKKAWIVQNMDRVREIERTALQRNKEQSQVDRQEAVRLLTSRTEELARQHGFDFNRLTIRNQKTRWGSCSASNNISLNMKLLLLPAQLRDYVILHELVHTRVKNHGERFWKELILVEPKARELSRKTREYNLRLP